MDKLQWFKFTPSDWMMGKIQRCPEITQARFMRLCCLYWNKDCNLSIEDAEIEIDKEHFDILVSKKIISKNETHFNISFLDEQYLEIEDNTKDKSRSGIIGNLKRWHPSIYNEFKDKKISLEDAVNKSKIIADLSHPDSTPIAPQSQNIAEKKREEKKIKDEIREEKNDFTKLPNVFLNNQTIKDLSNYMLHSEEHKNTFSLYYPKFNYEDKLIKFYNYKAKQGKLIDSFDNYSKHFFNCINTGKI